MWHPFERERERERERMQMCWKEVARFGSLRCAAAALHFPLAFSISSLRDRWVPASILAHTTITTSKSFYRAFNAEAVNSRLTELEAATRDKKQVKASAAEEPTSMVAVRINISGDIADSLAESLMCFGASSCSVEEAMVEESQEEIISIGPSPWDGQPPQLWKRSCITALFSAELDVGESIALAVDSIGLREMPAYEIEEVEDEDWIRKVQDVFRPVEVATGLWIVPRWCAPPNPAAINVILDPGLAFGTGEHPTTRLCLRWLCQNVKDGDYILDYGIGSGILSIAALKIGASRAAGVDTDPMAISSAQANADLNNLDSSKLQVYLATPEENNSLPFECAEFDIVVANILLMPLLQLVGHITNYARPGGRVAVSGIITDQVEKVVTAYSVFLEDIHVWKDDGWACVSGTRKALTS